MKKTKLFGLIIVVALLLAIGAAVWHYVRVMNDEKIRIAIYPSSGGFFETHYFEIKPNGRLLVEKGYATGDDLTQNPYMIRENPYKYATYDFQSEKKWLTSDETDKIYVLVNELYIKDIPEVGEIFDSWTIQILYKGKTIKQDAYYEMPQLQELIGILTSVSPVEVDLRDFA